MTDSNKSPLLEAYTLTSRSEILDRLRLLERRRALFTATPVGVTVGVAVTLSRILPERGLLAVETGVERVMVERLLAAEQVAFSGLLDGIQARFLVSGLREATLNGCDLLALPIPEALFWLQRRHYFRAFIPHGMRIRCRLILPDGESHYFDVVNLSVRGIALLDKSGRLRFWGRTGQVFEDCQLELEGFETDRLDLEIRGKLETSDEGARTPTLRVGFAIRNISPTLEAKIQRLLHELEIKARKERHHLDFHG